MCTRVLKCDKKDKIKKKKSIHRDTETQFTKYKNNNL